MLTSHSLWATLVVTGGMQKVFKIYEGGEAREILMTLQDARGTGGDGLTPEQASDAEPSGFSVIIAYKVSPETYIFSQTYSDEKTAADVMSDLSLAAGQVEALIRQEKFDEAEEATKGFLDKMKANTSTPPVEPKP